MRGVEAAGESGTFAVDFPELLSSSLGFIPSILNLIHLPVKCATSASVDSLSRPSSHLCHCPMSADSAAITCVCLDYPEGRYDKCFRNVFLIFRYIAPDKTWPAPSPA